MVSSALFTVVDRIFVGRGIGSDAIAAVNIAAPIFMIAAGLGLMFGMGGGILASINLSRGKLVVANINVTQSIVMLTIVSIIMGILLTVFPQNCSNLIRSREGHLTQDCRRNICLVLYIHSVHGLAGGIAVLCTPDESLTLPCGPCWRLLLSISCSIISLSLFLSGDCSVLLSLLIWENWWGHFYSWVICFVLRIDSVCQAEDEYQSIRLTLRNTWYMLKLGVSSCLSEITIAVMAIAGNYVFMSHLGTDGVAAYSIVCYLFPIIFMVFNAMVQSAQPIVSYNYGCGQLLRSIRRCVYALFPRLCLLC